MLTADREVKYMNNNKVRITSPKEVMIVLIVMTLMFAAYAIIDQQIGFEKINSIGAEMTEKQCTLVDMYSEQTGRSTKLYSDYQDADGNHYQLKSSTKDYVGRETTLKVMGANACRTGFEVKKTGIMSWLVYLCAPLSFFTGIWWFFTRLKD